MQFAHDAGPRPEALASASGASTPESARVGEQVKLRLSSDDAQSLRDLASARGVTVSALVADLVRDARR